MFRGVSFVGPQKTNMSDTKISTDLLDVQWNMCFLDIGLDAPSPRIPVTTSINIFQI